MLSHLQWHYSYYTWDRFLHHTHASLDRMNLRLNHNLQHFQTDIKHKLTLAPGKPVIITAWKIKNSVKRASNKSKPKLRFVGRAKIIHSIHFRFQFWRQPWRPVHAFRHLIMITNLIVFSWIKPAHFNVSHAWDFSLYQWHTFRHVHQSMAF